MGLTEPNPVAWLLAKLPLHIPHNALRLPDLANVEGQHATRNANFLSIFVILGDLDSILKPGYLSVGFDISDLKREGE